MFATWIMIIAICIVLHLIMHRGHGGHGGHDGRRSSGRGHAGHGCGPGRREERTAIDEPEPEESVGTTGAQARLNVQG